MLGRLICSALQRGGQVAVRELLHEAAPEVGDAAIQRLMRSIETGVKQNGPSKCVASVREHLQRPVLTEVAARAPRLGFAPVCWRPPIQGWRNFSLEERALEWEGVYYSWESWRMGSWRPAGRCNASLRRWHKYAALRPSVCHSAAPVRLSLLVQGFRAPASLEHSMRSWVASFLRPEYVEDAIVHFNERNESRDDPVVHRLLEPSGVPYASPLPRRATRASPCPCLCTFHIPHEPCVCPCTGIQSTCTCPCTGIQSSVTRATTTLQRLSQRCSMWQHRRWCSFLRRRAPPRVPGLYRSASAGA